MELGCGSGRHAVEFSKLGFRVTGIDRSEDMIKQGRQRIKEFSPEIRDRITLNQGEATKFSTTEAHDVVVSLFHVVSYQTTNDNLSGVFRSARAALVTGGLFTFDFWYGPGVMTERPLPRIKRLDISGVQLTRIAEPEHDVNRNVVQVKYTIFALDQSVNRIEQTIEVHSMRYLFLPEIELLAAHHNFKIIEAGEWLTGKILHEHCWSGYVVAQAVPLACC